MSTRRCPACGRTVAGEARYCGECGADTTRAPTAAATATSAPDAPESRDPFGTRDAGPRFDTGTVVAGRYRIVGLLGRGGMGEVYRADDLKLARPVALKFLPESVERDPARLNRLLNEVRTALSVSHQNVCRVHDVQQEAGRHFITMEFVDGDDLSALLRRIGRLPSDKALQIARQLCAGLGAAHAAGILHRDLKPANVMIDGRGQVKITDFGLAGLAGGFADRAEIRAGTPAYMAPEQLAGEQVSEASDIYALGLVLYEVYTGKPAYEGATAAEIARNRSSAPTSPSSHVTDMDPAVERVILRCLERDPADRPGSALAVSAALPGGDPLADALAAGETPAPELVAEAGAVGGLKPAAAWALLGAFVAFLALAVVGSTRSSVVPRADLPKAPAVLQEKAREILASVGHVEPPRDSIVDFEFNEDYLRHLYETAAGSYPWAAVERPQPAAITFGYRQSPDWILYESGGSVNNYIERSYPTTPGAARVRLDPVGRLLWLDVVPPERRPDDAPDGEPDWSALLAAAGFDEARLTDAEPEWLPRRGFDARRAWTGNYPDAPDVEVRLEAAAFAGRPVAFRIVEPWTRTAAVSAESGSGFGDVFGTVLFMTAIATGAVLAWRNVRLGRGDRRTALRFAFVLTGIRLSWYVLTHHTATPTEFWQFQSHLAWSLQRFGLSYVFYLAIEPYARKLWPRMLTSWVRLFDARLRDPLVARDVLIGLVLAAGLVTVQRGTEVLAEVLGAGPFRPALEPWALQSLRGLTGAILGPLGLVTSELLGAFGFLMVIFVMRLVMRRDALTLIPMLGISLLFFAAGGGPFWLGAIAAGVLIATWWYALFRVGLLTLVVTFVTTSVLVDMPLTYDLTAWWAGATWIVSACLLALAVWAFRMSLAGRPVFRDRILGA